MTIARHFTAACLAGLAACKSTAPASQDGAALRTAAPVAALEDQTIGGFEIGGLEVWPYRETQPLYPEKIVRADVQATAPARACLAEARRVLVEILAVPPPALLELRERYAVQRFSDWNNDYTGAVADGMAPASYRKPWLYGKTIKWVSETRRDGSCVVPERADLEAFAKRCLKAFPNC